MKTLLSEDEIINRVKSDWTKPLVTFLCATYNQEDYIEQTIIGFLEQKTSFPYEILIHDDNSTDGTKNIIEKYRLKYPNIIRCIYQEENKYSQGLSVTLIAAKEARSDYIALCEGDDYWVNENKIENQFKLMMSDESISMVVSPGRLEFNGKIQSKLQGFYGSETKIIMAQDVLDIAGQFSPTASYLLKKECLIKSREIFIKAPVGDLFIELYSAVFGKLVYHPEIGSVYRVMAKNSWSENMRSNILEHNIKYIESMHKIIDQSRSIKGFEKLDWSIKFSALYYNLAIIYLKQKKINNFKDNIKISNSYSSIKGIRVIVFYCRGCAYLLYFTLKPVLYFRTMFKRFFINV